MKNALRSVADKFPDSWTEAVPWVLYAYREEPVEPSNFSPLNFVSTMPESLLSLIKGAWTSLGVLISEKKDVIDSMLNFSEKFAETIKIVHEFSETQKSK